MEQIFAVTQSGGLWRATAGVRFATLTQCFGAEQSFNGGAIGLTERSGIVTFLDEIPDQRGDRDFRPDNKAWKNNSAPIVALSFDREVARKCAEIVDRRPYDSNKPWDPEFEPGTREVIEAVGDDHKWIVLSEKVARRFLPEQRVMAARGGPGSSGTSQGRGLPRVTGAYYAGTYDAACPNRTCHRSLYSLSLGRNECIYCGNWFIV